VPASIPALVKPTVLRWARESIGLTPLAAARKLALPYDRIDQWESGEAQPTIAQLRKAADLYRRPLGVFFLPVPPRDFDTLRDFRRHIGEVVGEWSPELHGEYRRAQNQRDNILELVELEDEELPTSWQFEDLPTDDEAIGNLARARLLAHAPIPLPRATGTPYEHLNTWTAAMEEAGVLILATSRGGVSTQEMRAFSLYHDVLPVVVVNGADGPRGRLFSMLHEYAHLLLHTAGLCDLVSDARVTSPDRILEARCNAIAAAVLMPAGDVLGSPYVRDVGAEEQLWTYERLRSAAIPFGVSAEAFLRRLVTLGRATPAFYQARREEFLAAYAEDEERTRASGGNWYRNTARDLGKSYIRRIADAHSRRVIDSYTAASWLNVKVDQIPRLAQEASLQAVV
jgi:Zn-dependent peptidase ImmA (M78 family)